MSDEHELDRRLHFPAVHVLESSLSCGAVRVYQWLAWQAMPRDGWKPTHHGSEVIAKRLQVSRNLVRRALQELQESGWLVVERRPGKRSRYLFPRQPTVPEKDTVPESDRGSEKDQRPQTSRSKKDQQVGPKRTSNPVQKGPAGRSETNLQQELLQGSFKEFPHVAGAGAREPSEESGPEPAVTGASLAKVEPTPASEREGIGDNPGPATLRRVWELFTSITGLDAGRNFASQEQRCLEVYRWAHGIADDNWIAQVRRAVEAFNRASHHGMNSPWAVFASSPGKWLEERSRRRASGQWAPAATEADYADAEPIQVQCARQGLAPDGSRFCPSDEVALAAALDAAWTTAMEADPSIERPRKVSGG